MMGEVEIRATSVFVNQVYVQHRGREMREKHRIPSQSFLILGSHELPNAVASDYKKASLRVQKTPRYIKKNI